MSDWRGHLKTGFVWQTIALVIISAVYIYFKQIPTLTQLLVLIPIFIISPLLPDLDHPSSKITKYFYLFGVIGLWITYWQFTNNLIYFISFLSLVVFVSQFINHRGLTHRLWFVILLHVIIGVLTTEYALTIISFSGMCSHLFADKTW